MACIVFALLGGMLRSDQASKEGKNDQENAILASPYSCQNLRWQLGLDN